MDRLDSRVLVVGARTTGLMMASELARREIPVRIVDASPGIDPHVRANLLHSRTLEILQGLGLAEDATTGSVSEHGLRLYAQGRLVGVHRHAPVDSPFPYGMSQSQAHTEAVLAKHLQRLGVEVERSVWLRDLEQHDDRVIATLEHPDGNRETIEAPWLIGCDGAHSSVRHLTGCAFPGDADPHAYVLGDVAIEGELDDHEGTIFLHDAGELFIFTMLPERRRLVCANAPPGHDPTEPPTLETLQALVDERGIPGLRFKDPRWLANFHIHYRLAPHYRAGRTFLAGDAAHVHSLLGGQGMNTGIQDAHNLAWKLALVMKGEAPAWWLDTYESERRAVGERVVNTTRAMTESMEAFAGLSTHEREKLVSHMFASDSQQVAAATELQELDLDYAGSPLCHRAGTDPLDLRPGRRAPDASPILVDGHETSLFRTFQSPNFQLYLFVDEPSFASMRSAVLEITQRRAPFVDLAVVAPDPFPVPSGFGRIHDREGAMRTRYRASDGWVCLVRPDGHIAVRSPVLADLDGYLSTVLSPTPPSASA